MPQFGLGAEFDFENPRRLGIWGILPQPPLQSIVVPATLAFLLSNA